MRVGRPRLDGTAPPPLPQYLAGVVEQDGFGVGLADVEDGDRHGMGLSCSASGGMSGQRQERWPVAMGR